MLRMLRDFFGGLLGVTTRAPSPFPTPAIPVKVVVAGSPHSGKSSLILNFLDAMKISNSFVNQEVEVLQTWRGRQYALRLVEVSCEPLPDVEIDIDNVKIPELFELSYEKRLEVAQKKQFETYLRRLGMVCFHADAIIFLVEANSKKSFEFMHACYSRLQEITKTERVPMPPPPMILVSSKEDQLSYHFKVETQRSEGTYIEAQQRILEFIAKEIALKRKDRKRVVPLVDYISVSVDRDMSQVFTKLLISKALEYGIKHLEFMPEAYNLNPLVSLKIREMLGTTAQVLQTFPIQGATGAAESTSTLSTSRSLPTTPRKEAELELKPEWFATWAQVLPQRQESISTPVSDEHAVRMV